MLRLSGAQRSFAGLLASVLGEQDSWTKRRRRETAYVIVPASEMPRYPKCRLQQFFIFIWSSNYGLPICMCGCHWDRQGSGELHMKRCLTKGSWHALTVELAGAVLPTR